MKDFMIYTAETRLARLFRNPYMVIVKKFPAPLPIGRVRLGSKAPANVLVQWLKLMIEASERNSTL